LSGGVIAEGAIVFVKMLKGIDIGMGMGMGIE
jgi:hypothetical protein